MGINRWPHGDVNNFSLRDCVILQQWLRVFPACKRADLELAEITTEINGDDIVKVRTISITENGALLLLI